jgi:hypothetical protein
MIVLIECPQLFQNLYPPFLTLVYRLFVDELKIFSAISYLVFSELSKSCTIPTIVTSIFAVRLVILLGADFAA